MAIKKVKHQRHKGFGEGKKKRDPKEQLFILEYCKNGQNAAKAALSAGYSLDKPENARIIGYQLLTKLHVRKKVDAILAEQMKQAMVDGTKAMLTMQGTAYFDPNVIFDAEGAIKPLSEWPMEARINLAGFEVRETFSRGGRLTGYVKKVKWRDGLKALENVCNHLGVLKNPEQPPAPTTPVSDAELAERAGAFLEKFKADY